jgi:hypothetical protein
MGTTKLLDYVAGPMQQTDHGVVRLGPRVVAFSNHGSDELKPFRRWLRRYGYVEEAFNASDEFTSWALLLSHPLGMPNPEAVELGLADAEAAAAAQAEATRQAVSRN